MFLLIPFSKDNLNQPNIKQILMCPAAEKYAFTFVRFVVSHNQFQYSTLHKKSNLSTHNSQYKCHSTGFDKTAQFASSLNLTFHHYSENTLKKHPLSICSQQWSVSSLFILHKLLHKIITVMRKYMRISRGYEWFKLWYFYCTLAFRY